MLVLDTTVEVIAQLGGRKAVAELCQIPDPDNLRHWEKNNKFPSRTYVALQEALRQIDCRAPASLWGMVEACAS